MATNSADDVVDYLGEYRRYFEEFVGKINPEDQLPMKVNAYSITETELVGEIIYLTLQYIKQPRCPRSLQGYLVRLILQEIKELCKKQPEECGFKLESKTYSPLKLMQTVTSRVNEIFTRYLDNNRLAMLPPPSSKLPPIARSAAFKNGKRKMEDRHIEIYDLHTICNVQNDSLASYFAVFDGHGGEDAAVYCATHLHQYLAESIYYPTDPERALCDAFHTTDMRFIEKEKTQRVIGGTTAVCVLLLDKKLYIAWVGDSLATLAKRGKVEELVYPHRLSRCDESERIRQMGGILAFNQGMMRVNGVLAVSRAIGDVQYKPYVTSIPDTQCVPLDGTEDFLIIATDGVWDFVNAHAAATIVYIAVRQNPDDPDYAATRLIKAAKYAGSLDNITAIVVFLTPPSEIAARPIDAHPLLTLESMINMAVNNPYVQKDLCAIDGMFFKQMKQFQQHPPAYDNDQEERHANGSEASMDDGGFHEITASAEGKNEENDAGDYIYGDLGPETDVDAVDDVDNVLENPILDNAPATLSQGLFHEEKRLPENENDFRMEENATLDESHDESADAPLDDDEESHLSVVNNDTKPLQHALLPEADNVADSEDSEDEWNYYRVGPNKEKDTEASSDEVQEIKNDNEPENVQYLDEDNNVEPQSSASEVNSECESQKEEILPELINTDISVEEKKEVDFPFVKAEEKEEEAEEEEKKEIEKEEESERVTEEETEHVTEEEEKREDEDMEFQLNPNAAEFIPGSPPKHQIRLNTINDSLVAGSPLKSVAMDDIKIPSQKEFDAEISVRPREMEEEKESPNGDHVSRSDYDFYTERQKVIGAPVGLDESEISSTKAEYGDESNMSSLYTTDLHKTGISTIEESFGESECDIYNRDNPMTMSYTPCDFKAAFKKEVDLNAVHDLSDGDLEDENGSFEMETPRSPVIQSSDIEHPMESNGFSNGDSSDRVQSFSGSLQDEVTFLKFGDSEEPRTEFMQVELERHQSSPIDPAFGQDEEKKSCCIEDSEDIVHTTQAESEQMETHKEANYVEDEKDIAENDIVTSETEEVEEKPTKVVVGVLLQSDLPQETSFQDRNFLSSTIHEAPKSVSSIESTPKSISPIEMEHTETTAKHLETDMISSMDNLVLTTEETPSDTICNLNADATESQSKLTSLDLFASGEPLSSDVAKVSLLEGSMGLMEEQPTQSEQRVEASFIPDLTAEPVSDERPTESLLDFNDTTTKMPIEDPILKSAAMLDWNSTSSKENNDPILDAAEMADSKSSSLKESKDSYIEAAEMADSNSPSSKESKDPILDALAKLDWNSPSSKESKDPIVEAVEKVDWDSPSPKKSKDPIFEALAKLDWNSPSPKESKDPIVEAAEKLDSSSLKESKDPYLEAAEKVDWNSPNLQGSMENLSPGEPVCQQIDVREMVDMTERFDNLMEITEESNLADLQKINKMGTLNLSESIQEFTGLEKQLEPENVNLEESPISEQPTIEDKTAEEVTEHKESVIQETSDEKLILDTKEEDILKSEENVDFVQVKETTQQPADTTEITMSSKTIDIIEPAGNSEVPIIISSNTETEPSTNIIELVTPVDTTEIETPVDTAETATPVDTAEIATPVDTAEIATPVDTAEIATPVDTAEIAMDTVETAAPVPAEAATPVDSAETAISAGTIEIATPVDTAEITAPVDSAEIAIPADTTEVATLADIAKAATTANIVEAPTNVVESANLVDATTTKTEEIVETADIAKIAEISKATPTAQAVEEQKPIDSTKTEEPKVAKAVEPLVVGAAAAAVATATAVGVVSAAATSTSKAKAKPAAKTTKPGATSKVTPKSTPTSPSKSVSSTTRTTTTATTTKKTSATPATRPKQLDTAATKTTTSISATKTSATKTVPSSKPTTSTTKTTAARPTSAVAKTKPTPAKSTTASVEKKSVLNGDVKSLSKGTTAKPASKPIATSASPAAAKAGAAKTTTTLRSSISATATTTTTKPRPTSATTAARSPAKSLSTTSSGTPNAAKTKTTPTSNSATKLRTSLAKSPMIDKQIKESANKQISSMARTTSSSKTTRTSTSATTISSVTASTTKRLSSSKSTTTTASPVKKVVSKVASGNSSGAKMSSSTTKVKVMQNGTADTAEITKTTIITNIKNEDDVPKKDLSPVVAPTDNQLIVSAD